MYSEEWLYGKIRQMEDKVRSVWPDLQAMASKPPFFGSICIAENIGYSNEQLSGLFNTSVDNLKNALDLFKKEGWITVTKTNVITLTEWERFQSDYLRTKNAPSRTKKSTPESTSECSPPIRSDQIRLDLEEEREEKVNTKRFIKPTIEEIAAYCKERKNNIDAEYFFNSYESKGWKIGNTRIKSWKACVITWEKNNFDTGRSSKQKKYGQVELTREKFKSQLDSIK